MTKISRVNMTGAAWIAAVGLFAGTYDVTALSVLLVHLRTFWNLSSAQLAFLTAAPLAGSVVGSVFAGLLADRLGRRLLLLVDFATFVVAALLAATAPGYAPLLLWRSVMGIGIGADFAVVFPYLAETIEPSRRGATMALVLWVNDVGQILAYGTGTLFARLGVNGFRYALLTGAALGVIALASRRSLPESPSWLKRHLGSVRALAHYSLRKKSLQATASSAALWFLHQVTGQGLTLFLPLVVAFMWSGGAAQSGVESVGVKLLSLVGGLIAVLTIDRLGRRVLQWSGFLGRGLALLGLALLILFGAHASFWVVGGLLSLALAFGAAGPDKTTVIATAERFPTPLRASGQGMAEMIGRLGGVTGVLLFGMFVGSGGLGWGLMLFAGVALTGAVLTYLTLPETLPTAVGRPGLRSVGELSRIGHVGD